MTIWIHPPCCECGRYVQHLATTAQLEAALPVGRSFRRPRSVLFGDRSPQSAGTDMAEAGASCDTDEDSDTAGSERGSAASASASAAADPPAIVLLAAIHADDVEQLERALSEGASVDSIVPLVDGTPVSALWLGELGSTIHHHHRPTTTATTTTTTFSRRERLHSHREGPHRPRGGCGLAHTRGGGGAIRGRFYRADALRGSW